MKGMFTLSLEAAIRACYASLNALQSSVYDGVEALYCASTATVPAQG